MLMAQKVAGLDPKARDFLLKEPIEVKDGYIPIPQGPGLGAELDPEAVAEYSNGSS